MLRALIPYSDANLKLVFKPSLFFADLERVEKISRNASKNAFYRAIRQELIEIDEQGIPRLTEKGRRDVKPFVAKKLAGAKLMIIFDIPENERWKRTHLRQLLRELSFKMIQQSVWSTDYDHRDYLKAEISNLGLARYVQLYEAHQLKT